MGFGKDGKGAIVYENRSQVLGTLGVDTTIIIGTKLAITKDFRMLKNEAYCVINGLNAADGEFVFGMAHGDLTVGEIDEALELNGPLNRYDDVSVKISMRPVFRLGATQGVGDDATEVLDKVSGAPMCISKPRWTFGETTSWNYWIRNVGATNLITGAIAKVEAKSFGVWFS